MKLRLFGGCLTALLLCFCTGTSASFTDNSCIKNILPNCTTINKQETIKISYNDSCVFECLFDSKKITQALQFEAHLKSDSIHHKLFLTIEQEKEITSYTLPHISARQNFSSLREELCPNFAKQKFKFTLSSPNSTTVIVLFKMGPVALQLTDNNVISEHITPFSPRTLMITWGDGLSDILVLTKATSDKDVCSVMVLRNAVCPLQGGPKYLGDPDSKYQMFTSQGALRASREDFPDGIFVLTYTLVSDHKCTGMPDNSSRTSREKGIAVSFHKAETLKEASVALWVSSAAVIVAVLIITIIVHRIMYSNFMRIVNINGYSLKDLLTKTQSHAEASSNEESIESSDHSRERSVGMIQAQPISNDIVPMEYRSEESEYSLPVSVSYMSETLNPSVLSWWSAVEEYEAKLPESLVTNVGFHYNIALVGGLILEPIIEVIKSYTVHSPSHLHCIFNERCSIPAGPVADFIPVLSSGVYCMCALGFHFLLRKHENYTTAIKRHYQQMNAKVGLDYSYNTLRALSYGLFLQGVISGLYHMCPNESTLNFDMLFMYVMAVLFFLHLHGIRHSNVHQSAYSLFAVVISALFLAKFKNIMPNQVFWTLMIGGQTVIIGSTTFLMAKMGLWSLNPFVLRKVLKGWHIVLENATCNLITGIRVFVVLLVNIVIAILGFTRDMNPYMYILDICVAHICLCCINYVVTKIFIHKERGRTAMVSVVLCVCGLSLWILALVFYGLRSSESLATPAESLALNVPCILFKVFSYHDLWHMTSSFALFFSFIAFLIFDDDMICTNIKRIKVF